MNTLAAYLIVIAVWATTPLGIKWSGEALPAFAAAGGRMALAALLGVLWLMVRGQGLPLHRRALSSYGAALPGIFGAMGCSYMAARDLPSGLLSVVFGMAPLISGVMLLAVRGGARFNGWHWMACLLGLVGLGLVLGASLAALFGGGAALEGRGRGMLWILAAVSLFALSGIVVQRVGAGLAPMQQTVGGLIGSLPLYGLAMLITGQGLQWSGDLRGLGAIVYLAVFGSLVGFYCYFLVLSRLPAATVALVTLITPVLALSLGAWLNDEQLGPRVLAGAAVIVAALGLYLFGDRRVRRQVVSATVGDG
ncbi:DMT family transporter [Alloalcanivorax gelatiniphagus]|uniref:DMT family transporter n=1 Tax=Alloalcanivorax gelatiniphagus TaxID=1194167 RepID=UPI00361BC9CF